MANDSRPTTIQSIEDLGAHLSHWSGVATGRGNGKRDENWLSAQLWQLDRREPDVDLACSPATVRSFVEGRALLSGELLAAILRLLEVPEDARRRLVQAHGVLNGDLPAMVVEPLTPEETPVEEPAAPQPEAGPEELPTPPNAEPIEASSPPTKPSRARPRTLPEDMDTVEVTATTSADSLDVATAEMPLVTVSGPPTVPPTAPPTNPFPSTPDPTPRWTLPEMVRQPDRRTAIILAAAIVAVALVVAGFLLRPSTTDDQAGAPNVPVLPSDSPSLIPELGGGGVASSSPSPSPKETETNDGDTPAKDDPGPKHVPEAVPRPGSFEAWASAQSGMCLNVAKEDLNDGAPIIQYGKSWDTGCAGAHEQWAWVGGYGPDGSMFKIVNKNSGKCVDVVNRSTDLAAGIVQATCADSGGSQVWSRAQGGAANGWEYMSAVKNLRSGFCVDNHTEGTDGLQMWQANCGDFQAQTFRTPA